MSVYKAKSKRKKKKKSAAITIKKKRYFIFSLNANLPTLPEKKERNETKIR